MSSSYPSLNYLGSKKKLLEFIEESIKIYTKKDINEIDSFLDGFSGTGIVSFHMLKNGCKKVISNDIQYYSYISSSNFLLNDSICVKKLQDIIDGINNQKNIEMENAPKDFFVFHNYSTNRKYFTPENGIKIDMTRQKIEKLYRKEKCITKNEYELLIKILLYGLSKIANIASVYGAFLKQYKKSSQKQIILDGSLLKLLLERNDSKQINYNKNITELLTELPKVEIFYADSPYNQRSYDTNFHVLETVAKYDNPLIKNDSVTGTREETTKKSKFCSKTKVKDEFDRMFKSSNCKYIFVSYSSDGIVSKDDIIECMKLYFNDVVLFEKPYKKFQTKLHQDKIVTEYIFAGTSKYV